MTMTTDFAKASPKTRRRVRYEFELEHEALDCVFAAARTSEFKLLMEGRVYSDPRWDQLPDYRKVAVEAYVRGALDFAARTLGKAPSQPPDAVLAPVKPSKRPSARAEARPAWVGASGVSYPAGVFSTVRAAARRP